MAKLTPKQSKIIDFLKDKEEVKKSEIVKEFSYFYFGNQDFHIGNLLSTMVKQGRIFRPKIGYYTLNKSNNIVKNAVNPIVHNQRQLF